MELQGLLILLAAVSLRPIQCQQLQESNNGGAVPIWGLSDRIRDGESNMCNKTFADANATGIYYMNPNVSQGPQAGQADNYNGSTLNSSWALTIYNPGFTNTLNDSSSYSLWYNTNGANYSDDSSLGYDVCAIAGFSFNYNTLLRGQTDNGSCLSTLDQPCVSAIKTFIQQSATRLTTPSPGSLTNTSLPSICRSLSHELIQQMPSECSPFIQDKLEVSFALTSYGNNFDTGLYSDCTLNGTWQNMVSFYNNASQSTYTSWVRSITPTIFVWMPIPDAGARTVITETVAELFCGRVNSINPGSYRPPAAPAPTPISNDTTLNGQDDNASAPRKSRGDLSGGAIAGIIIGVVVFVALMAGLFFWLRRKMVSQQDLGSTQGYPIAEKPDDGLHELTGDNTLAELETEHVPVELPTS